MNAQQKNDGSWKRAVRPLVRRTMAFGRRIPPGLRTLLGVLLIVGGSLGFLPILGFWMLPLGVVLIMLDFRDLRRFGPGWHKSQQLQSKDDEINDGSRPASQSGTEDDTDDQSVRS